MIREIYRKLDSIVDGRLSKFVGNLAPILPLSKVKKNILLNKKEIDKGKIILSSYPYNGVLNLTDACNLRCKFCEIHYVFQKYPIQYKNFIDVEVLKKYYPLLSRMRSLAFYGATGEPLSNPFSPDVIQFLKKKNPEIYLSVNTNGLLLTDRVIKAMIETGFDDVLISIHSVSKETYQYLIGGNYERLIRNIKKLISGRDKAHRKKPQVGLTFALNKINAKDALDYPKLGKELKVDYININHYYHVRNLLSEDISFYFSPQEGNEILRRIYKKAENLSSEVRKIRIIPSSPPLLPENFSKNIDLSTEYSKQILRENSCYEPFITLKFKGCVEHPNSQYITVCNRIMLLWMNYKEYDFKNSHRDIWNHPTMLYMRSTVNKPPYNPICKFCRNKMTPIIRCLDNTLYRKFRDGAVKEFFKEVKDRYQIPKVKGIEMLEDNPYE